MALGRPIGAKLFLEGKEVPFVGATITCAVNQASIAYVDLVPHKTINDIKPRTLVQIFVRVWNDEGPNCVFPYVLAWEGEVFGINFGKTPASRNFSISCIDYTSYWDNVMAYYFNAEQTAGAGTTQMSSEANTKTDLDKLGERIIPVVMSQAAYFKTKIEEVLKTTEKLADNDPNKKDFLDGIAAIYADIGLINEFFREAEDRLRIKDRIVMHSSKLLYKLLKDDVALAWFTDLPGRTSGFSSLRFVIQDLMAILFHDSTTIPFPAAVRSGAFMTPGKAGLKNAENIKTTIGTYVFKPNLYMMPPPKCNIFFPDEYASFQFSRNFFKEPTRLTYSPELPAIFSQGAPAVFMPRVYEPPVFNKYMKSDKGGYANYENTGDTGLFEGEDPKWYYAAESDDDFKKTTEGLKREPQLLTKEEHMKGIIHARESVLPASSSFRMSLDDYNQSKRDYYQGIAKYLFYKKRFQDRTLQITSHLKLSVVPGFPVLILDDSEAYQNVVAYCSSVTHRIYSTEGGYTNVQLTYARNVAEQQNAGGGGAGLLIPPWFAEEIFGMVKEPDLVSKVSPGDVNMNGATVIPGPKIDSFYATLLGDMGSQAVTSINPDEQTLLGATNALLDEYRKKKLSGVRDVQQYIYMTTRRQYIRMKDAMSFISASTKEVDVDNSNWTEFSGAPFSRPDKYAQKAVEMRMAVITKYRDTLKTQRGFRG